MSLNWREIELVLSELPLVGSSLQQVHQLDFHALLFELYHPREGRWELYVEVGTPSSRLHRVTIPTTQEKLRKTVKLQRFIQYIRAHVEGSRIVSVSQNPGDRLVRWELDQHGSSLWMVFRFYSGAGANVIICDQHMTILDLLYRRPARGEISNGILTEERKPEMETLVSPKPYPIRERIEGMSFNSQLEKEYRAQTTEQALASLVSQAETLRDKELSRINNTLTALQRRLEEASSYESYKRSAELLAGAAHLIKPKTEWVEVPDYFQEQPSTTTISLDPHLSAGENIEYYFHTYQKMKRTCDNLQQELEATRKEHETVTRRFNTLLAVGPDGIPDLKRLRDALSGPETDHRKDPFSGAPGLRFVSGPFTILVGRNAKENDGLLRRWTRGNDYWMHTRDVPGGYVFIKTIAMKTIPLETLLDAATLALLYSKAKDSGKANLYYTQVKYLRRVKDGKLGLVLPTQEKNFFIELDDGRVSRLFSTGGHEKETP